jgi:hypothetical protein
MPSVRQSRVDPCHSSAALAMPIRDERPPTSTTPAAACPTDAATQSPDQATAGGASPHQAPASRSLSGRALPRARLPCSRAKQAPAQRSTSVTRDSCALTASSVTLEADLTRANRYSASAVAAHWIREPNDSRLSAFRQPGVGLRREGTAEGACLARAARRQRSRLALC